MEETSIIFHNDEQTVFLVDIPASIAQAQELSPLQRQFHHQADTVKWSKKRHLLSSSPLETPYPSTTEPKTDPARAKVLERIPVYVQAFHTEIEFVVQGGLKVIQDGFKNGLYWCFPRYEQPEIASRRRDSDSGSSLRQGGVHPRKRKWTSGWHQRDSFPSGHSSTLSQAPCDPPMILSPSCLNTFGSFCDIHNLLVKNTSPVSSELKICHESTAERAAVNMETHRNNHGIFHVPPLSNFSQCTLPMSEPSMNTLPSPIPGLPHDKKFNLILMDPPWSNKSVRRSGHYQTHPYSDIDALTQYIQNILDVHLRDDSSEFLGGVSNIALDARSNQGIAAIWITNSAKARKAAYTAIQGSGLFVCEEWAWIKTTSNGEPISQLNGLWRKPYEILIIGKRRQPHGEIPDNVTKRVVAAVPDVHSRKPNLREVFEKIFFSSECPSNTGVSYSALEVFARNLTAGWWSCGNEVLKFNSEDWWVED